MGPELTLEQTLMLVQQEHALWAASNFPDTTPELALHGIVEELGEFSRAPSFAGKADAIGDMLLYIAHYCTKREIRLNEIYGERESVVHANVIRSFPEVVDRLANHLGRLAHANLKRVQSIRLDEDHDAEEKDALVEMVNILDGASQKLGRDLEEVLFTTWKDVVKKRDWTKDPVKGVST